MGVQFILDSPSRTCGYMHRYYANALAEFGMPRHLNNSDGWILVSPIDGATAYDARGCYPLFSCQNWTGIEEDLEDVGRDVVSLVLVTDPFGGFDPNFLRATFRDLFVPYKEHYVVDLTSSVRDTVSGHHGRNVRKALRRVDVEHCDKPKEHLGEWLLLYGNLIRRHKIKGISAFSSASFERQMEVPGLEMFRGISGGETVGIVLCYVQGDVAYYHLAAYSEKGYELRASFAIFAYMIEYFATRLRWVNLGAGAGVEGDESDGLTRFKKGWATVTRTAYLCGRVFDRALYEALVQMRGIEGGGFFPLYRRGEIS